MSRNKTLAILVAITLIASIAIVSASASVNDTNNSDRPLCPFSKMGLHRGMMVLDSETMEARMEERLAAIREKLSLPEDASKEEIWNAMKEEREALMQERLSAIKEKLGLPEDASEEEVKTALTEWREENRNLIIGLGRQGFNRHMRPGFRGMKGFR